MPIPALIAGGAAIASSIIGNIGSKKAQKRADATNLANWQRQNIYNHPQQQMDRLRQAGLNPNLVYGQGGGSQQVGDVAPSKAAEYKMDLGDPIGKYYQMKSTAAQTNNLLQQNIQIGEQILLIRAQASKTAAEEAEIRARTPGYVPSTIKATEEARIAPQVADFSLEAKAEDIKQQKANLTKTRLESGFITKQHKIIEDQAAQALLNAKTQGEVLALEKIIKQKVIDASPDINPNDPWIYRQVQLIINKAKKAAGKEYQKYYNKKNYKGKSAKELQKDWNNRNKN